MAKGPQMTADVPVPHLLRAPDPVWMKVPRSLLWFAKRKPLGAIGGIIIVALVFSAIFADQLAPYDPLLFDTKNKLKASSMLHLMGTDEIGRDVFSRIIYGSRVSVTVGLFAVGIGTMTGSFMGVLSAYFGGRFDLIVQRVMDSIQSFPLIILALSVVALLGPSVTNVIAALAIVLIPGTSRVIRSAALSTKEHQYVDAARALGATHWRIMFQHILPNVASLIIVLASIQLGGTILAESSLSFLGVGPPPPTPTWGAMLSGSGRKFFETAPWLALWPGIAISLAIFGFNLLGDGLRDVLDPRLKGSR